VVQAVDVDAPHERAEDLEARGHDHARPDLGSLPSRRLVRSEVEDGEREDPEQVLLPQGGGLAVGKQPQRDVDEEVGLQPVRLQAFSDSLDYLIVPRSSMRLPCSFHPVPAQVITCSCMIGKWSLEVVVSLTPGRRNGFVSLSWLLAIFITLALVRLFPACLSTSTMV